MEENSLRLHLLGIDDGDSINEFVHMMEEHIAVAPRYRRLVLILMFLLVDSGARVLRTMNYAVNKSLRYQPKRQLLARVCCRLPVLNANERGWR